MPRGNSLRPGFRIGTCPFWSKLCLQRCPPQVLQQLGRPWEDGWRPLTEGQPQVDCCCSVCLCPLHPTSLPWAQVEGREKGWCPQPRFSPDRQGPPSFAGLDSSQLSSPFTRAAGITTTAREAGARGCSDFDKVTWRLEWAPNLLIPRTSLFLQCPDLPHPHPS